MRKSACRVIRWIVTIGRIMGTRCYVLFAVPKSQNSRYEKVSVNRDDLFPVRIVRDYLIKSDRIFFRILLSGMTSGG